MDYFLYFLNNLEMMLYITVGVFLALSVLVAVLDKKISHGIFFFLSLFVLFIFFLIAGFCALALGYPMIMSVI